MKTLMRNDPSRAVTADGGDRESDEVFDHRVPGETEGDCETEVPRTICRVQQQTACGGKTRVVSGMFRNVTIMFF